MSKVGFFTGLAAMAGAMFGSGSNTFDLGGNLGSMKCGKGCTSSSSGTAKTPAIIARRQANKRARKARRINRIRTF